MQPFNPKEAEQKMNWQALVQDRCPKCECKLMEGENNTLFCALYSEAGGIFDCDFKITKARFDELKRTIKDKIQLGQFDQDNQEELNNL